MHLECFVLGFPHFSVCAVRLLVQCLFLGNTASEVATKHKEQAARVLMLSLGLVCSVGNALPASFGL